MYSESLKWAVQVCTLRKSSLNRKLEFKVACKRNFENPLKEKGAHSIRFNDYLA